MKTERIRALGVCVAFLLAAAWFFVPVGKPEGANVLFAMRLALPAAVLAVGGIGLLPWLMTTGFFFCAVGDAMGVLGSFEGQMGGFAVAHICFIIWLAKKVNESMEQRTECEFQQINRRTSWLILIITILCLTALAEAVVRILPKVDDTVIRIGCAIYSLLLTGTLWMAWMRTMSADRMTGKPLLTALGATSFFVSDFVLAWNRFVHHIPNAGTLIMTTYYAALLLLFIGETAKNKKKSHF